jgi:hypothetical protein
LSSVVRVAIGRFNWLHPELEAKGLREAIEAVLAGRQTRL